MDLVSAQDRSARLDRVFDMDQEEVQRLRRAIRSAQKRLRQDAMDERWSGLTLRAVHVCLLIYVLASDAGVAASYADAARRRRRRCLPPAVSTAPICVSQWFLEVPLETLEELMSPTCARSRSIHREAQIYMAEHRTAVWVGKQNSDSQVAPQFHQVAARFETELPSELGYDSLFSSARGRDGKCGVAGRWCRKWCNGFAKKFSLSRRWLPQKPLLSMENFEVKAGFTWSGAE